MEPRREPVSRTAGTRFDGCGCTLTKRHRSESNRHGWIRFRRVLGRCRWSPRNVRSQGGVSAISSTLNALLPHSTQLTEPPGPRLDLNGCKAPMATDDSPARFAVQGTGGLASPRSAERG